MFKGHNKTCAQPGSQQLLQAQLYLLRMHYSVLVCMQQQLSSCCIYGLKVT